MAQISRRFLLGGAAALTGSAMAPRLSRAQPPMQVLRALPGLAQLAPEGFPKTDVWAYATADAGSVPGPELRVQVGQRITRRLINDLPQATAIHWHGLRIDNAMDGAAPLTQAPVPPGGTFDYDFIAPDPGTYWYHSHNRSWEQVARGLAGPLIVEDRTPWLGQEGAATREMTLVLDDWLLDETAKIVDGHWEDLHAAAHGGRLGNTVTVNGMSYPKVTLRPNERVRLRLINTATARIMRLSLPDLSARLIALDGHPVAPRDGEILLLGPAQRADIVIDARPDAGDTANLLMDPGNGDWVDIAAFQHEGAPMIRATGDVRPLPDWGTLPAPDLSDPQRETLLMEGGAMGGMTEATYQGTKMEFRELASHGMVWSFNGAANNMETPWFSAQRGRTVHATITNRSAFAHAIHLHGHHFRVLTRGGVDAKHQDVHDTVLIAADETIEIAFVADNPGRWMVHCHMLAHQASGMMSWFEVV